MKQPVLTCPPVQDNLISTLNKMGYMMAQPEALNQAFIDFSATVTQPVLEIGCAYGLSSRLALAQGATVIANDLDPRHLEILKSQTPMADRPRLHLKPGRMPEDLAFSPESLGAILSSRMINFISPDKLQHCFDLMSQWLCPGGKLFLLVGSPYMGTYAPFLSQYRLNKIQGVAWPGFIDDMPRYTVAGREQNLPEFVTLLDKDEVQTLMEQAGFQVEILFYEAVDSLNPAAMKRDGREYLAAIGVKS